MSHDEKLLDELFIKAICKFRRENKNCELWDVKCSVWCNSGRSSSGVFEITYRDNILPVFSTKKINVELEGYVD